MSPSLIKRIASRSTHRQHAHVAVITRGGAIVSVGHNHDAVHAEASAIFRLWPKNRRGARRYSFRMRRNGTLGMARPCPACWSAIVAAGISDVYYSDANGRIIREKVRG